MPLTAPQQRRMQDSNKKNPSAEEETETAGQESEETPDKSAVMKRLLAQGAVSVFPFSRPSASDSPAAAPTPEVAPPTEQSVVRERSDAPLTVPSTPTASMESAESESAESESSGSESQEAFHRRVEQQTEKANNPSWYNLPQHIENARHGKWDLSQSRSRRSALTPEEASKHREDILTSQNEKRLAPSTFDVGQKAKNAINDVVSNPGQTAAGMIPLVGTAIKAKMKEKYDVKERDVLKGISATTTDDSVKQSSSAQAAAVSTQINNNRFKAAVGTVTGAASNFVPGGGAVSTAATTVAGAIGDQVNKKELASVTSSRAREQARKKMGRSEFAEYENVDQFMNMEDQRHALVAAGKAGPGAGGAGPAAPSLNSQDEVRRMVAHTRGDTPFHAEYKKRAKEVQQERAAAAAPPGQSAGFMSKVKNFFSRS
ncbi:hypothetical protein [Cohnella silvisoli]|uniref:Uncharacterized protein n=1 Tax=Cohnella silvisoli TaxID=2873699 RepID=A0ABV1KPE8_9BACL|nr:hypothetical protein [Cohnella silvisoli]MCD9022376.1 hypothetical protein [Cohnella silvisoli]